MSERRAVILGAAGFIGSHLVDRALAEGWRVTGVDNLITGTTRNLEHLAREPRFDFIEADICVPLEIAGQIHAVLDFASPASPIDYLQHPFETLHVGSIGVENALKLARSHGATFLLSSTSEVYGDPLEHPQRETYWGNVNPIGPRGVYDEAKRFAEAITLAYHRAHGVDTKIVRIFNMRLPLSPDRRSTLPKLTYRTHMSYSFFGQGVKPSRTRHSGERESREYHRAYLRPGTISLRQEHERWSRETVWIKSSPA